MTKYQITSTLKCSNLMNKMPRAYHLSLQPLYSAIHKSSIKAVCRGTRAFQCNPFVKIRLGLLYTRFLLNESYGILDSKKLNTILTYKLFDRWSW